MLLSPRRDVGASTSRALVKGSPARSHKLDGSLDPIDNFSHMADIIDLSLVAESRKYLKKLLEARGIAYFLRKDARRPFQLEPEKVDLVVRAAVKTRNERRGRPHRDAFEHARREVRRELIRRVVAEMISVGL